MRELMKHPDFIMTFQVPWVMYAMIFVYALSVGAFE